MLLLILKFLHGLTGFVQKRHFCRRKRSLNACSCSSDVCGIIVPNEFVMKSSWISAVFLCKEGLHGYSLYGQKRWPQKSVHRHSHYPIPCSFLKTRIFSLVAESRFGEIHRTNGANEIVIYFVWKRHALWCHRLPFQGYHKYHVQE